MLTMVDYEPVKDFHSSALLACESISLPAGYGLWKIQFQPETFIHTISVLLVEVVRCGARPDE